MKPLRQPPRTSLRGNFEEVSRRCAIALIVAGSALAWACGAASQTPAPTGLWRGTSTCTDLVAAPACKDEVAVYAFSAGTEPDTVHWQADKVIDDQRQPMGELDLRYDAHEACWKAQFDSPRTRIVWCLTIDGARMSGTGRILPGDKIVRRVQLSKESPQD